MMNYEDYERKIQHMAKLYKECSDPASKKILFMRGKLLRMGQSKLKHIENTPEKIAAVKEAMDKPLEPNEVYDVAKMIFG